MLVTSILMMIYITKFFWTEPQFYRSVEIAHDRGTESTTSSKLFFLAPLGSHPLIWLSDTVVSLVLDYVFFPPIFRKAN
jgi:hypothetical protein